MTEDEDRLKEEDAPDVALAATGYLKALEDERRARDLLDRARSAVEDASAVVSRREDDLDSARTRTVASLAALRRAALGAPADETLAPVALGVGAQQHGAADGVVRVAYWDVCLVCGAHVRSWDGTSCDSCGTLRPADGA